MIVEFACDSRDFFKKQILDLALISVGMCLMYLSGLVHPHVQRSGVRLTANPEEIRQQYSASRSFSTDVM